MITVVKQNTRGETKIQYQGEVVERVANGVTIQAFWRHPAKDLGYITFEPGDCFTEYYFSERWFNIFDISDTQGKRKGWYCNIAEPAVFFNDRIEQVDLLLDVWVHPTGQFQVLDEDEFFADTMLTDEQRSGAQRALQELLQMIVARQEMFCWIADTQSSGV